MKMNPRKNKLAVATGLGAVVLVSLIAYAATTVVVAVGTIPHSELLNGPATVTFRTISFAPGEVGCLALSPWASFQCRNTRHGDRGRWMWRGAIVHRRTSFRGRWPCP